MGLLSASSAAASSSYAARFPGRDITLHFQPEKFGKQNRDFGMISVQPQFSRAAPEIDFLEQRKRVFFLSIMRKIT